MKKQLLFSASLLVSGLLCAQVARKAPAKIPANLANKSAVKIAKNLSDNNSTNYSNYATVAPKPSTVNSAYKTSAMTQTVIGGTYYDLQSNSSVGDRIVVNADGSIAAVWTIEPTDPTASYLNRGTGYAYFDGANWNHTNLRIENAKVGWGNIVNTRSGRELVLSHNGGAAKLHLATRAVKGTGAWNNSTTTVPTATTGGNFWPRMVASGDTVYAISLTYPTGSGGAIWQGLDGAVVFSRSLDQGVTWDMVNVVPAGLTSATFRGFGGDAYAIASKGSTVVIVAGDADRDVVMSKSTDAGVTWSSTTVMESQMPDKWDHTTTISDYNGDAVADTLETNDGTYSIGLDRFGSAYVFFGRMRIFQEAVATTQTYSYFPGTDGLYMWRESFGADSVVMVAAIEDLYGDNNIFFPTPSDPAQSPWGTFGCSLTSYPSVAFDEHNTMFLMYSSLVDSLQSIASSSEKLVRHQYIIQSCDGGDNWSAPYEIDKVVDFATEVPYEGVYGSLAKTVDGNLHFIYQKDLYAGFGVNATDDIDNLGNFNDIVYVKLPTADLPLPSLVNCAVGVKDLTPTVAGLNFYPNPASSNGTIEVVLNENSKMDISIINNVGQTVYATTVAGNGGINKIDVSLSNLAAGLYFYQVKIGNSQAVTKKFAVGK